MNPKKLQMLRNLPRLLMEAVRDGVRAYANGLTESGGFGATPLVDSHFTRTNAIRYGFAPLSPKYAAWKTKTYGAKAILVRSGDLRQAVDNKSHVVSIRGSSVIANFSNLPDYAIYHHEGGPHLPKRSPVELCEADRLRVIEIAKRYLAVKTGENIGFNIT